MMVSKTRAGSGLNGVAGSHLRVNLLTIDSSAEMGCPYTPISLQQKLKVNLTLSYGIYLLNKPCNAVLNVKFSVAFVFHRGSSKVIRVLRVVWNFRHCPVGSTAASPSQNWPASPYLVNSVCNKSFTYRQLWLRSHFQHQGSNIRKPCIPTFISSFETIDYVFGICKAARQNQKSLLFVSIVQLEQNGLTCHLLVWKIMQQSSKLPVKKVVELFNL